MDKFVYVSDIVENVEKASLSSLSNRTPIYPENIEKISEKLEVIKEVILKKVPAKYIYLFGSYAYGEPTKDSDIDICVIVSPNYRKDRVWVSGEIMCILSKLKISCIDVFIQKENVFRKDMKDYRLQNQILLKGLLLYEKRSS